MSDEHQATQAPCRNEGPDHAFWHILVRDDFACQLCGTRRNLQVHHVCFRSQGGTDSPDNLVTVCQGCHAAIHAGRITLGACGG